MSDSAKLQPKEPASTVVWLTGLSGSGKTTLCNHVAADLQHCGHCVQVLDGDEIRKDLCRGLSFSEEDRFENIRRIAFVASLLSRHRVIVLVAAISPLRAMRELARQTIPSFVEVYVDAPLEVCETRDPKGLYKKARQGIITGFTGIDAPYEIPIDPDVICRTSLESIAESAAKILHAISQTESFHSIAASLPTPTPDRRRPTIAVDFDGVIANYDGWIEISEFGAPRSDVIHALQQLRAEGWKVVIYSTRCSSQLSFYLDQHDIPYDEVNTNSDYHTAGVKPVATVYWDDRALKYSGNAYRDIELIRSFRTWSGRA
jgi:adenylylsulfate kinase